MIAPTTNVERVVIIHGPADPTLIGALTAVGLVPSGSWSDTTVWGPGWTTGLRAGLDNPAKDRLIAGMPAAPAASARRWVADPTTSRVDSAARSDGAGPDVRRFGS